MAEDRNVPIENRLLALLPPDVYERLRPNLRAVSFSLGEVVYEFGGQLEYVLPHQLIISLLYTMENGSSAEMGLTGNDGVVGIAHKAARCRTGCSAARAAPCA